MAFSLPPPKLKRWSRRATERAASFRVFAVDKHAMDDGEGKPRGDFFTFQCTDWCNVIAVTETNEVVFVWQYRFGTDALSLEIPGGVIDPGESPVDAARRELLEESGYAADHFEPLLVIEPNPALQGNVCHTFVARGARKVAEPTPDANEELELTLVSVDDLPALLDLRHVTHALVHSALEVFLRRGNAGAECAPARAR
jgi:ADP-ribose pyrophosphatase